MKPTAKILLVDDEPGMLRYIKTLLEVDDYKVETATTGEEAVQRIEKGLEPDLVLLDVLMPGIDGLQTLEMIRQKQPAAKVVMLSCVSDTRKVVQAMRLGALDYLTRLRLRQELIQIWEREKRTVIFVTHDVEEAVQLADRVVVMGKRPARIRAIVPVDIERMRDLDDPACRMLRDDLEAANPWLVPIKGGVALAT